MKFGWDSSRYSTVWIGLISPTAAAEGASVDDLDVIIVGVLAPKKDKEETDEDKEIDPIVFSGKAKELDEALGGALIHFGQQKLKSVP